MRTYADLIREDNAAHTADAQAYFRCLDAERARAFDEAREAGEDYAWLLRSINKIALKSIMVFCIDPA